MGVYLPPGGGTSQQDDQAIDVGNRFKIITHLNPHMAAKPEYAAAAFAMANSTMSNDDLVDQAGAVYGMMTADTIASQLKGMSPGTQRALFKGLSKAQQDVLNQQGYAAPGRDKSWFEEGAEDVFGAAGGAVKTVFGGPARALGTALSPVLNGLTWTGDRPAHAYRTIRMMDEEDQDAALLGAGAGAVLALALIPATGGLSALAIGGGGALLGGTAAAFASNPSDFRRAFSQTYDGEKAFNKASQRKSDDLLGDPRLVTLALDFAGSDYDTYDLARDLAGRRDDGINGALQEITKIAGRIATPGTPEFAQVHKNILDTFKDPIFQEAVQTLQNGKISFGRDIANGLGLDPGSGSYDLVSGVVDATWVMALDPTLVLGKASQWKRARQVGIPLMDGADMVDRFRALSYGTRDLRTGKGLITGTNEVRKLHVALAEAVQDGNITRMRQIAPDMEEFILPMLDHRDAKWAAEGLKVGQKGTFTHDDFFEMVAGQMQMAPLMRGLGTVRGASGIRVRGLSPTSQAWKAVSQNLRSLTTGMSDVKYEDQARKVLDLSGSSDEVMEQMSERLLPSALYGRMTEDGMILKPWQFQEARPAARVLGRKLGELPGVSSLGEVLTRMTTMIPAGRSIALTGADAPKDIRSFIELGSITGMPAWARKAHLQTVMDAPNVAARMQLLRGFLDNALTVSGIRALPEGEALAKRYLDNIYQTYGAGVNDVVDVAGANITRGINSNDLAVEMVMPDLRELRKVAMKGHMAKALGLVDLPVLEQFTTKIWKPAVLLRPAFIVRAAGEEYLNFLFRGGIGSMTQQFGARSVAHYDTYRKAQALRLTNPSAITEAMEDILRQGPLPAGLRSLGSLMARSDWTSPLEGVLHRYSSFLREGLREGAHLPVAQVDRTAARAAARAGRAIPGLPSRAEISLNFQANAGALLLGSKYSVRRMLLGGVDDSMLDASTAWAEKHATTMMGSVSAVNSGPVERATDPANIQTYLEISPAGKEREVAYVISHHRNQRYTHLNDDHFASMLHGRMRSKIEDPTILEPLARETFRIVPPNVRTSGLLNQLPEFAAAHQDIADPGVRLLVNEYLATPSREGLESVIQNLLATNPKVGRALQRNLHPGESSLDSVREVIDDLARRNPTDEAIAEFKEELDDLAPLINRLARLDVQDRAWMAAALRSTRGRGMTPDMIRAELAGKTTVPQTMAGVADDAVPVETPTGPFFVDSFEELTDDLVSQARAAHLRDQDMSQLSERMLRSVDGRAAEPLQSGQVMLYVPAPMFGVTFDQLVSQADNPQLLLRNRETVEKILAHDTAATSGTAVVVADITLAEEMTVAGARVMGTTASADRVMTVRLPRDVIDGRFHETEGFLTPISKRAVPGGETTEAWSVSRKSIQNRLAPIDRGLDDAATEWAQLKIAEVRRSWVRGAEETMTPRFRNIAADDGTITKSPVVYRKSGGELVPVGEGEKLSDGKFFRDNGDPIKFGNEEFFMPTAGDLNANGDVMYAAIGPMIEDTWDDLEGINRLIPKAAFERRNGDLVASSDMVRAYRSNRTHIQSIGDGIPNMTYGPVMSVATRKNALSRMVEFGFDRVIGPGIDSLARRPMAFHFFQQRFQQNRQMLSWLVDPAAKAHLAGLSKSLLEGADLAEVRQVAKYVRTLAGDAGEKTGKWSDQTALAWLRGHKEDELSEMLSRSWSRAQHRLATKGKASDKALAEAANALDGKESKHLLSMLSPDMTHGEFLAVVRSRLPENALDSMANINLQASRIADDPILSRFHREDFEQFVAAEKNWQHINKSAGDYAAEAAINDMLPFIDSHEFKTQFAEVGRGFLPFWYAEENFMKRWARTIILDPTTVRKMQLGYMGLRQAGVVRTDENGRDWFVYPGSGLLQEVVSILGRAVGQEGIAEGVNTIFQSSTDAMLPGLNSRFGTPQVSPVVAMPLDFLQMAMPEVAPLNRALAGDFNSARSAGAQAIPATLYNLWDAMMSDTEGSSRISSATMAAIAQLQATDGAIDADSSAGERDAFLRKARDHGRIVAVSQWFAGLFTPGSPSQLTVGSDGGFLSADNEDPRKILSAAYSDLVTQHGMEQGTIEFLEIFPLANLTDIVNPLALTVGQNTTPSGAPIPPTEEALAFFDENRDYFEEFPAAGPWLFPQAEPGKPNVYAQYARDQFTINGLMKRRTPEEFLTKIMFKEASGPYFANQAKYEAALDQAKVAENKPLADKIQLNWDVWSSGFRTAHPVFDAELASGDGRQRRADVLAEMRYVLNDPAAPKPPHFEAMGKLVTSFDRYQTALATMREDRTAEGVAKKEKMKLRWGTYLDEMTIKHPALSTFILSIIQPESSL